MDILTHLPPSVAFALFLLGLGLLPLVLAWREARARGQGRSRLAALRHEARVTAKLRAAPR
jgi:hypothetical protein